MSFVTTCSLIGQFTGLKISHISVTLSASVCVCYLNVPTAETKDLHVAMLSNCLIYFLAKGDTMYNVNCCSYSNDCLVASSRRHASLMRRFFLSPISKKHHCNMSGANVLFVSGLSTPVEMKLKLIPIFRHMHFDLQLTAKVSRK